MIQKGLDRIGIDEEMRRAARETASLRGRVRQKANSLGQEVPSRRVVGIRPPRVRPSIEAGHSRRLPALACTLRARVRYCTPRSLQSFCNSSRRFIAASSNSGVGRLNLLIGATVIQQVNRQLVLRIDHGFCGREGQREQQRHPHCRRERRHRRSELPDRTISAHGGAGWGER